jgi:hypothetical protein
MRRSEECRRWEVNLPEPQPLVKALVLLQVLNVLRGLERVKRREEEARPTKKAND